ncbi:MAG: hypothetical protein L3J08_00100 [Flavobacteriaceae bacterium]|nr:hypothetical protein [Flavobacteriaceae bacterium]
MEHNISATFFNVSSFLEKQKHKTILLILFLDKTDIGMEAIFYLVNLIAKSRLLSSEIFLYSSN